jgi:hypothetical protein
VWPGRLTLPGLRETLPKEHHPAVRVGLVGCTKSKRPGAFRAADLYSPSALFRGRRAYVERTCDRWFVLSALYGLVEPETMIEPYDVSLTKAPERERRDWSERALKALDNELGGLSGHTFECHAGAAYLDHGLVAGLRARGATVERPTDGLSLGQQLSFYSHDAHIAPKLTRAAAESLVPPRPDLIDPPGSSREPARPIDAGAVVAAMLAYGDTLPAGDLIALGPDPESDKLLKGDGFAFLLAVILDQGIRYERAWRAPLELRERLGHLDPARMVADPDAVRRAVAQPPALHRYVNNMPAWLVSAARRVLDEYAGNAPLSGDFPQPCGTCPLLPCPYPR